jgi:hypothetical protein
VAEAQEGAGNRGEDKASGDRTTLSRHHNPTTTPYPNPTLRPNPTPTPRDDGGATPVRVRMRTAPGDEPDSDDVGQPLPPVAEAEEGVGDGSRGCTSCARRASSTGALRPRRLAG